MNRLPKSVAKTADTNASPAGSWRQLMAWCVHLFTAAGAVCGLLAVDAIARADWRRAFAWMIAAVVIDSVDGAWARHARVKQVLPQFDGGLLDNLVDFVTYVLVPAFFVLRAELVPPPARLFAAAVIVFASGFQFCQRDAKTADHYFKGFPSYWNVVVFYLFLLRLPPAANLAIVLFWVAMTLIPIKYIYPSRTRALMPVTIPLTVLWGLLGLELLRELEHPRPLILGASLVYVVYYVVASLFLTARRRLRSDQAP